MYSSQKLVIFLVLIKDIIFWNIFCKIIDWAVHTHKQDVSVDLYIFPKVPELYERINARAVINLPLFKTKLKST